MAADSLGCGICVPRSVLRQRQPRVANPSQPPLAVPRSRRQRTANRTDDPCAGMPPNGGSETGMISQEVADPAGHRMSDGGKKERF